MKKIMNVLAFIVIIGFVGAWECGNYDLKTLLFNTGVTLSLLFIFHIFRIGLNLNKELKQQKKHKIKNREFGVKIS